MKTYQSTDNSEGVFRNENTSLSAAIHKRNLQPPKLSTNKQKEVRFVHNGRLKQKIGKNRKQQVKFQLSASASSAMATSQDPLDSVDRCPNPYASADLSEGPPSVEGLAGTVGCSPAAEKEASPWSFFALF